MELPYADQVQIDRKKITDYLLSDVHPDGSNKARFFKRFGFRAKAWKTFELALRKHAGSHSVVKTLETTYGVRYTLEGELEAPDGRRPRVRTVWAVGTNSQKPRFITAYPC